MIRRYLYPVEIEVTTADPAATAVFISNQLSMVSDDLRVRVGEPADITPKSAADRASRAVKDLFLEWHPRSPPQETIDAAVRAAVGEDTP